MRDWREYFTVVQWDQRGAGKTYLANDPEKIRSTMTVDRMVADAEEIAAYLRKTYNRRYGSRTPPIWPIRKNRAVFL